MSSGTGYLVTDGRDMSSVFFNINDNASLNTNNMFQSKQSFAGDIDLSGSLLFYSMPSTIQSSPYSVGYTLSTSPNYATNITSGNNTSLALSRGVWLLTVSVDLYRGGGTYTTGSFIRASLTTSSDIIYSPPNPLIRIPIESGNTNINTLQLGFTAIAVLKNNASSTLSALVNMTVGGTTNYTVYFGATKIA